ncbi:uracil-DNA glycosylase [Tamlana sp. 62-3]|uniref:Uracil-DNA glycosylase n=1 Tax=Neotamlana sargassicola TaxID=2883125 RepID=A0A9X1I948_9FLAO|nr:uracil-DNA glycosylase [Tamlana sargassicola]MCB4808629.1 uracil-DNA glycosylase [Tamlana sargassicola]
MTAHIHQSWLPYLQEEFNKTYFKNLMAFVSEEYRTHDCFPPKNEIFNAFNVCPFNEVKVVIIGQDPYHDFNQANGLCFSVNDGIKHPPSLVNIFKEIEADLNIPYPKSGNLMRWAKQGILLLNATLTVRAHKPSSHQKKGWEIFTNTVIKELSINKTNLIFLLWGGYAKQKAKLIDTNKHHVLTSGHPSPLSANRGYWFGNKHFSKTNYLLEQVSQLPLIW